MSMSNADKSMVAAVRAMVGQIGDEKVREALRAALDGESVPRKVDTVLRKEVLSAADVATMLNCTRRTVGTLCRQGLIRKVAPGRRRSLGYRRDSVEAFIRGERPALGA